MVLRGQLRGVVKTPGKYLSILLLLTIPALFGVG